MPLDLSTWALESSFFKKFYFIISKLLYQLYHTILQHTYILTFIFLLNSLK